MDDILALVGVLTIGAAAFGVLIWAISLTLEVKDLLSDHKHLRERMDRIVNTFEERMRKIEREKE